MGEYNPVGSIQGSEIDLVETPTRPDRNNGPQKLPMLTRIERWRRQFVPARLFTQIADFPYKVIE